MNFKKQNFLNTKPQNNNQNNDLKNKIQQNLEKYLKKETTPPNEKNNNKPIETNNQIQPIEKKIKKPKEIWKENYVIKNISYPEAIEENQRMKKKYKIKLSFEKDGKNHTKTIRFGKKNKYDYLDDLDEKKRDKLVGKLGNTHNPLHPNFWRYHLLNTGDDLKKNYLNLINKL